MVKRNITNILTTALADSPVVLLNGARQSGKSTLVQWLVENEHPATYLTLDDPTVLAAIHHNPTDFLQEYNGNLVLDEVQRAPELFLAMKRIVDKERKPGKFLMTGSANVLLLPHLSESLAGRMEILSLWPFAQSEIKNFNGSFIDSTFSHSFKIGKTAAESKSSLIRRIITGGYPEVQKKADSERRRAWFNSYITTILQRDVRDLANINGLTVLPRLLSLLATRAGTLLNIAEIANSVAIPQTTLKRYLSLLETTFLIQSLRAWSGNFSKRLIKTPKLLFTDTGLMTHLIGVNHDRLAADTTLLGRVLENFVAIELFKDASWSKTNPQIFYFRTSSGQEVDFVLESPDGQIVGIEVKASSSVDGDDFRRLKVLSELAGKRFVKGLVLYTGSESIPFGKNIFAVPADRLWNVD
jgi:predicted AAA+ superfamily ATPase